MKNRKDDGSETIDKTIIGLVRGVVIGGIIMVITQNPLIGLIAFVFGATGLPKFNK